MPNEDKYELGERWRVHIS